MQDAPFRADLAEGPANVRAVWAVADDEVRTRVAVWPADDAKGTILLFPGRTEYVEKYGRVARDLTRAGYSVAAIDWRGQGFADRLVDDRLLGHVMHFKDYQKDVAALLGVVDDLALPGPRFLLAHSMGGCIGLRALIEGLPVERVVFSAPMWGIEMLARQKPMAATLPGLARLVGQGHRYTPGSRPVIYTEEGFVENPLTGDPDHFAYLAHQLKEEEQFTLGGPSLHWLGEALKECRLLRGLPKPGMSVLTFMATEETVVSNRDIERHHRDWSDADLRVVQGARHEIMMEVPEIRSKFFDEKLAFLDGPSED